MIRYLVTAVISFCLGGLVFGGYEAWQRYESEKIAAERKLVDQQRHQEWLDQQERRKLEERKQKLLVAKEKLKADTGVVVEDDLRGFKNLLFSMDINAVRKLNIICNHQSSLSDGRCHVPSGRFTTDKPKYFQETALGETIEDLQIVFKNSWGPITTVDEISFSVPVPLVETKEIFARQFGKSYTHHEKYYDGSGEQIYWLFRNGGVITLRKPRNDLTGSTTRLVYLSPRLFAKTHSKFISRFGLNSLFDGIGATASFDETDI